MICRHQTPLDGLAVLYLCSQRRKDDNFHLVSMRAPGYTDERKNPHRLRFVENCKLIPGAREQLIKILESGGIVVIFANGDLIREDFHSGAFALALAGGAPVIPVNIETNLRYWLEKLKQLSPELATACLLFLSGDRLLNELKVSVKEKLNPEELVEKYPPIETPEGPRFSKEVMKRFMIRSWNKRMK